MIDTTTQITSILIILLVLVITAVMSRRRRNPFTLRPIAAFAQMPSFARRSIEADRPVHLSIGSAGLGGESTILAIASAELAYQVALRASVGGASPILTLSDTSALPLGQDTIRRAYQSRGLGERFRASSVRWYPSGSRSLAFAAAITAMMSDDDITANILAGSFGPELALIMDSSARRGIPALAVSDQLEGQAVAYAMADEPLIGEEIFAGGAYLGGSPSQTTESVTIDIVRWLLVIAIVAAFILTIRGG